ncbi:hypothetical protein [Cyclobacterium jeungdonense]|uniref:Uncharacterized protein n=1 Tax=Cyclobacterium jeungdonense TaxID=708087 RepID=A0ABT8CAW1_9BACT|nr:hypothetical protein [Cyclobacterium jeungdonense]MDN3688938.1 hypothetical protein [Cyclobacterium jeungdonense]
MKCIPAILLMFLCALDFCALAQPSPSPVLPDFEQAFEGLSSNPSCTFILKNHLEYEAEGGHLQGIQRHGKSTLFMSGSAELVSYMVLADLSSEQTMAIDTLMGSPFRHAGGFQIFDHYLAVGIEDNQKRNVSVVQIYDLNTRKPWSNPVYSVKRTGEYERVTAGAVGLTAYRQKIWLLVANWDSKNLDIYSCPEADFYRRTGDFTLEISIDTGTELRSSWSDPDWHSYQNINLFTDQKDKLYLVGTTKINGEKQVADLYQLILENSPARIRKLSSKFFYPGKPVDFKAAAGLVVRADGYLELLAAPYQVDAETRVDVFSQSHSPANCQ